VKPLLGDNPIEGLQGVGNLYLGRPAKLCGAPALVIRGPEAARRMLKEIFPIGADSQLDYRITHASLLNFYVAAEPLAAAPLSEAGDTDIQRIPEKRRAKLQLEAHIRHALGDQANIKECGIEDLKISGALASLLDEFAGDPLLSGTTPGQADLDPEALLAEVAKSQLLNKMNNRPHIAWTLAGPFCIIGSWDDWKNFRVMEPVAGTLTHRAVIKPVQDGVAAEFQIVFDHDWKRRFFPESIKPGAMIFGPANKHGKNWVVKVPHASIGMTIIWDPTGMRRVDITFERKR